MAANPPTDTEERLGNDTVLIVGGGPAGLVLATTLAYYDIKSVIIERNDTTTRYPSTSAKIRVNNLIKSSRWPKMDLTNARSMELFRKLGLADDLRAQGQF
jgi:FAD-dependent monooxygenase